MFDRFTERARKVMGLARQEAVRFSHEYLGTAHILLGLVQDLRYDSRFLAVEAGRRLGQRFKINLEGVWFIEADGDDPAHGLSKDHFLKLELVGYF